MAHREAPAFRFIPGQTPGKQQEAGQQGEASRRGRSHPPPNADQAEKIDLVAIAAGLSLKRYPDIVGCRNFGGGRFT